MQRAVEFFPKRGFSECMSGVQRDAGDEGLHRHETLYKLQSGFQTTQGRESAMKALDEA